MVQKDTLFYFDEHEGVDLYLVRASSDTPCLFFGSPIFLSPNSPLKQSICWLNLRSVMPLDVLGRTRATLKGSACFPFPRGTGNPLNPLRGRDRGLQLFPVNQEFPVSASHKLALITSLPFVHTARRYYRLNVLVRYLDWTLGGSRLPCVREDSQT